MQFETRGYAGSGGPSVFVIEAEQVVRSALYYILRVRFQTHTFATVEDAFASTAATPDAVLIGAALLRNGGKALLARLRRQIPGAKLLVIAERNSGSPVQPGLEPAIQGIIPKPISFDPVHDAVDTALLSPFPSGEPARLIRPTFA